MDIEKYIERKIKGLNVLRFSDQRYTPGAVIDVRKNDDWKGHLRDVLASQPDAYWEITHMPANILLEESVSGSRKFGANTTFMGIFSLKSGFKNEYDLDYEIDHITSSVFAGTSPLKLETELKRLEKSDPIGWKSLKGRTLITSSFYARSFTLTFSKAGKLTAKADVERELNINAGVKAEWTTEGSVKISGNEAIPFGIRGFKMT